MSVAVGETTPLPSWLVSTAHVRDFPDFTVLDREQKQADGRADYATRRELSAPERAYRRKHIVECPPLGVS